MKGDAVAFYGSKVNVVWMLVDGFRCVNRAASEIVSRFWFRAFFQLKGERSTRSYEVAATKRVPFRDFVDRFTSGKDACLRLPECICSANEKGRGCRRNSRASSEGPDFVDTAAG